MRLLLDAHALIWAVDDPSKLGPQALGQMNDSSNQLFISAGTVWEIAIKVGLEKLSLSLPFGEWMNRAIADLGATALPIEIDHADAQRQLPGRGDPFDRLLVAQANVEGLSIVSADVQLDQFGIQQVW